MTYLEEAEKLKAEYKMKISEIENKSETLGGRDSYVSKECHNAMIDFMCLRCGAARSYRITKLS